MFEKQLQKFMDLQTVQLDCCVYFDYEFHQFHSRPLVVKITFSFLMVQLTTMAFFIT
jgi:hypothetical protein